MQDVERDRVLYTQVNVSALLSIIKKNAVKIFALMVVMVLLALWVSYLIPDRYTSTSLLIPSNSNASSASALSNKVGNLASLAGIGLADTGVEDKAVIALRLMKTWGFLEEFVEEESISPQIFAVKSWDQKSGKLRYKKNVYNAPESKWRENKEPTSWLVFEEFEDMLNIETDSATGIISFSITYVSPVLAKEWNDKLVNKINQRLNEKDKNSAIRKIDYLKQQISVTNVTEMKSIFYGLIEENTTTLMLASVEEDYALKTISQARVMEEPESPNRILIVLVGGVLGAIIGFVFVVGSRRAEIFL